MVVSGVELMMSRRQIREMIMTDVFSVTLKRRTKLSQPSGGWKWSDYVPLEPQNARLIPFKRRVTEFLVNTEIGDVPDLPYILLGFHTMDAKRGDKFTYRGDEFELITADIGEPEVKCLFQVDYYGGGINA